MAAQLRHTYGIVFSIFIYNSSIIYLTSNIFTSSIKMGKISLIVNYLITSLHIPINFCTFASKLQIV